MILMRNTPTYILIQTYMCITPIQHYISYCVTMYNYVLLLNDIIKSIIKLNRERWKYFLFKVFLSFCLNSNFVQIKLYDDWQMFCYFRLGKEL